MTDTEIKLLCPQTGEIVGTGIDLGGDAASVRDTHMTENSFECPACGLVHIWDKVKGETMATVQP